MSDAAREKPPFIARSIGPYSLVNGLPLGGAVWTPAQQSWLFERGLLGLFGELAVLKGDSALARVQMYEELVLGKRVAPSWERGIAIVHETPAPYPSTSGERPREPASTEGLASLAALLGVLALGLSFDGAALSLRYEPPLTPALWSFGEVREVATYDETTFDVVEGGLFCPRIFGPFKDYACRCGKLVGMKHRGSTCPQCGVEIVPCRARRRRFGHIVLASPVVPAHLRAFVSALLGDEASQLMRSLEDDGGVTLAAALDAVDVSALLASLAPSDPRRPHVEALASSGVAPKDLVWNHVPVLPADLRPLVRLADGRWAGSNITDLYFRLLDRNAKCRRAIEEGLAPSVVRDARAALSAAVDGLVLGAARPHGEPYRGVATHVQRLLVASPRKTDYSAVASVAVEPQRVKVGVPFAILEELSRPIVYGMLEKRGLVTSIKAAKARLAEDPALFRELVAELFATWPILLVVDTRFLGGLVEPVEGTTVLLPPAAAARLEATTEVTLHLPTSELGIEETRRLAGEAPPVRPPSEPGSFERLPDDERAAEHLTLAALRGDRFPIRSAALTLLTGGARVQNE